jgi:DNA polymerase-3 subunit delta'
MPLRDVVGHRRVVALLARSIARESLPPSLIFAGPSGAGKRLTAISVAQALNCQNHHSTSDLEIDACGACQACMKIARGLHPDVLVIEPNEYQNIKMEQVRDAIDRAAYRPFEGRCRVVIIDEADALVPQAQNALLKTLEEPPSLSVFILVTAHPDVLLPTVLSRCHRLSFRSVRAQDIAPDERETARAVLEQSAKVAEPERRIESAKSLLPKSSLGSAGDREHLASHLRAMASLLRDIELLATRADTRALANPDVEPALERLTDAYRGERGVRAFTAVDQALVALERNAGVKVVADWLVLQL